MEGDNIFRYRNMDIKLGGREMASPTYKIGAHFLYYQISVRSCQWQLLQVEKGGLS